MDWISIIGEFLKNGAVAAPWGKILQDMAIAQGWVEPV